MLHNSTEMNVARQPKTETVGDIGSFEPIYMIFRLQRITKKLFDERKRDKDHVVASRPIGFLWKDGDEYYGFFQEDNEYYQSQRIASDYTAEMFMTRETKGIEVSIDITFKKMRDQQAA